MVKRLVTIVWVSHARVNLCSKVSPTKSKYILLVDTIGSTLPYVVGAKVNIYLLLGTTSEHGGQGVCKI
jgi:hypothetical protein